MKHADGRGPIRASGYGRASREWNGGGRREGRRLKIGWLAVYRAASRRAALEQTRVPQKPARYSKLPRHPVVVVGNAIHTIVVLIAMRRRDWRA